MEASAVTSLEIFGTRVPVIALNAKQLQSTCTCTIPRDFNTDICLLVLAFFVERHAIHMQISGWVFCS